MKCIYRYVLWQMHVLPISLLDFTHFTLSEEWCLGDIWRLEPPDQWESILTTFKLMLSPIWMDGWMDAAICSSQCVHRALWNAIWGQNDCKLPVSWLTLRGLQHLKSCSNLFLPSLPLTMGFGATLISLHFSSDSSLATPPVSIKT